MARPRIIKISKDKLRYLYLDRKLSSRKIAKKLNCNKATILEWLHRYYIPTREVKRPRLIEIPQNKLKDLYINKKLSGCKIAKSYNTDPVIIYRRLHEYGIPRRSISEALKGRTPWNKGKYLSNETKKKLRKIWKEFWRNPKFRKKMKIYNKKSSERMKGERNPMKRIEVRKKVSVAMKGKLVGNKNPAKKLKVRRKISKALEGHKIPPEVRKEIAQSLIGRFAGKLNPFYGKHHTKEVKEKSRRRAIKQLISGELRSKTTSIELKMERKLKKRNIYYKKQFPLLNRTTVDFYLPKYRAAIYCDGIFWHKSDWAKRQGVVEKDRKQTKILSANGYKVFRLPEAEINNSPTRCVDEIVKYIKKI